MHNYTFGQCEEYGEIAICSYYNKLVVALLLFARMLRITQYLS